MNWQEVCESPYFQDIPFKVELNRWGQIIMSPAKFKHSILQGRIGRLLIQQQPQGEMIPECAIQTEDSVKVADITWLSTERYQQLKKQDICTIAPEICIEIKSASNSKKELLIKKDLYLKAGAFEVWLCNEKGEISFYNKNGAIKASEIIPQFPKQIDID
ncbi:Uma2 family endonuclease [Magnetococcales bacterium HHB-1]